MAKRIRKALVGGFWAGVSAVGSGLVLTGAPTRDQLSKMLATFIVAFAGGVYAVWKVRNAGSDIGPTGSTIR